MNPSALILATILAPVGASEPPEAVTEIPDWNHDVASVVAARCTGCHRPNGAGPFSLESPGDLAARASFVMELVESGRMPPSLVEGEGWRHDRRLSPAEVSLLRRWFAAGAPVDREDPDASPVAAGRGVVEAPSEDWVTRRVAGAFVIPAESDPAWHAGEIDQRGNAIPLDNDESWRVREIRIETAAPQAMRVASMVFDPTGAGRYLDDRDPRVGFLMAGDAGLVPSGAHGVILGGQDRLRWPDGFHQPVPPGSDLVVEWHYRPTGIEETMRPSVRLHLLDDAEAAVSRPLRWLPIGVGRVQVPAESVVTVESAVVTLDDPVDLVGVTPRALEIATDVELLAWDPGQDPGSPGRRIIAFRDWDHHQRETVISETPRRLAAGTRLQARFRLDNRSMNPANPDSPAVDIRRGRRTGILAVFLHVAAMDPESDERLAEAGTALIRALRGRGGER